MPRDLKEQIENLKDEHAAEIVTELAAAHDEKAVLESMFFLGRVKQIDADAHAVSTALSSQAIRALEHFQQNKMFEVLGYRTFVDFLEKSEYSPMSKHQFYERLALLRTHGDEIYDLLTSVGISVRSQKMLGSGELAIKGDRLVVGDKEVAIDNVGIVKDVLNELFDERREFETASRKKDEKIQKLEATNKQGQKDYDELQRNLEALQNGDPFDNALAHCVRSHLLLQEQAGELSDKVKAKKAESTLATLWDQLNQLRRSLESNFTFTAARVEPLDQLDVIAAEVNRDDADDLD